MQSTEARKNIRVIGILAGVLSIVLAIVVFCAPDGYWESSERYGGDAYTGIQNAAAQTANNVNDLAYIARIGLSSILFVNGIALICFFSMITTITPVSVVNMPTPTNTNKPSEVISDELPDL